MPRTRSIPSLLILTIGVLSLGCAQPRPVAEPVQARPIETLTPADPVHPIDTHRSTKPGDVAARTGDEIMIAGQLVHTGAPVVLWFDPPMYDAYRVNKRFAPAGKEAWDASPGKLDSPNRYSDRPGKPANGWTPESLAGVVDQIVMHYDAAGVSRSCFRILHDVRGLSIHFMVDVDGTIYQSLDVKERAWHATIANDRSVGIEIANIGAYPPRRSETLDSWYQQSSQGTRLTLPGWLGDGGIRDQDAALTPSRASPITGTVNGTNLVQFDLTDAQYESLARLSAALCTALPQIRPEAPRDSSGKTINHTLTSEQFARFRGILGHFHVQGNKIDPGPAFDWDRVLRATRAHMGLDASTVTEGR